MMTDSLILSCPYADPGLVELLECLAPHAVSKDGHIGHRIATWLVGNSHPAPVRVYSAFAGTGQSELTMASVAGIERLVLTDASNTAISRLVTKVAEQRIDRVECRQTTFPLLTACTEEGVYQAVTALGCGLLHLRGNARRACLADFFSMLSPGGFLFVDNKHWTGELREEGDSVAVYPIYSGADHLVRSGRILAVTRDYPESGVQRQYIHLMGESPEDPPARFLILHRWCVEIYPVRTAVLLDEMRAVGFQEARAFNAQEWPNDRATESGIDLIVARRPALMPL